VKLGGHETFYPRPGWLTKGLLHLQSGRSEAFSTPEAADALGVGRNMAKSIAWWLQATGLAEKQKSSAPLRVSDFGQVVAERDPFMTMLGTWWLVHVTAQTAQTGTCLPWFFSPRRPDRFNRATLIEDLSQEICRVKGKPPALKSVQREVAAMLQTYAVPVPRPAGDPEDNLGSPLHRLDLLRHVRATDRFERTEPTPAPPEAQGLLLSSLAMGRPTQALKEGVALSIPVVGPLMAGASTVLGRNRDALLDLATRGEKDIGPDWMGVRFLASERVIAVRSARAATWARTFYDRIQGATGERAA